MMDMKRVERIERMFQSQHFDGDYYYDLSIQDGEYLIQTIKQQQKQLQLIRNNTFCEDTDFISVKHVIRKRAEKALEELK